MRRQLTEEEAKKAEREGQLLVETGLRVFKDEMRSLRGKLEAYLLQLEIGGPRTASLCAQVRGLIPLVDQVKYKYVSVEPGVKAPGKEEGDPKRPTVSLTYEYPDALWDWLKSDASPGNIRVHAARGVELDNEELVKDV